MARKRGGGIGKWVIGLILLVGLFQVIGGDEGGSSASAAARSTSPAATGSSSESMQRLFVTASSLNVRSLPSGDAEVLGALGSGQSVTQIARNGPWAGVRLPDGRTGWVHGDYLSSPAPPQRLAQPRPRQKAQSNCPPSYARRCLPIGRDLDCKDIGGSVRVVGPDVYRLDRDGDGVGCER